MILSGECQALKYPLGYNVCHKLLHEFRNARVFFLIKNDNSRKRIRT